MPRPSGGPPRTCSSASHESTAQGLGRGPFPGRGILAHTGPARAEGEVRRPRESAYCFHSQPQPQLCALSWPAWRQQRCRCSAPAISSSMIAKPHRPDHTEFKSTVAHHSGSCFVLTVLLTCSLGRAGRGVAQAEVFLRRPGQQERGQVGSLHAFRGLRRMAAGNADGDGQGQ